MTRELGLRLQAIGCVIVVTPMLMDHFLFSLKEGFLLCAAVVAAALLIAGIAVVKVAEARAEREAGC